MPISMSNVTRPVFFLSVTPIVIYCSMVQLLPLCRLFSMTFATAFMKSANKYLSLLLKFLLFFLSMGNTVHALFPLSLSSPH